MRWAGTSFQIAGAVLVAWHGNSPFWGYAVMFPGAVLWTGVGVARRDWALATMQMVFVSINMVGLWRWSA